MNHPKSGQTCHAARTEQNHEGEKALHTKELQNYNHDNDSKQEENTMALRADLLKTDLRIVERQDESTLNKIFEKAAERAINRMTLDERIESFRRWPFAGEQQDFKALLKMQYERDTEDYSNPGTWYGVIRKWQAMTEEEALAAFRTEWNGSYSYNQYTQEELKDFYNFIKERPLPALSPEENIELYDRRHDPACLKKLFAEMDEAKLVHIFEHTYDYNHAAAWTVCEDDLEPFRNEMIRPDVLESLLYASVDNVNQPLKSNIIPFNLKSQNSNLTAIKHFRNRRGFITLAWGGDYELLTGLRAMDYKELAELAQEHGIQPDEYLFSLHQKLKEWSPPKKALPENSEPPIGMMPEAFALYETFTDEEDEHFEKLANIFNSLPNVDEEAPIHNLPMLSQCLEWLCDEDLLQLKAAIDWRLEDSPVAAIQPPPHSKLASELQDLLKDASHEQVELFGNEPVHTRIAKAISHPKHYQCRYDYLQALGLENTEYGVWLKNLVAEYYHQDYSQPATEWGVIQRMMAMTLDQFATELEQLQDKRGVSLAIKREDSDIDGLYQAVLDAAFTDEQREEFYLESGLNGHVKDFISNLPDSMQCLFEDYRDAIAPDWADLSHPGAAGDDGLKSVISELLELPMDLLMLLPHELPKHQLKSEELVPNTEPINHELLEELRAMGPEERAKTMAYIKQMED